MKKGISLIAVLMFMLAATTASVVLFKWIGSENYASGARLKQSEAYQASEAGLDAVYSWLSFKAADVGAVVKNFFPDKKPYELTGDNNVLGSLSGKQKFRVYLTGVDTNTAGRKPFKLKFLSIGESRDGSEVKQTAVYGVNGLYRLYVPTSEQKPRGTADVPNIYGEMATTGILEVATAVLTQSLEIKNAGGQALNRITIGTRKESGYLVLDGNYYTNNGINIYGDLYSTGNFDLCASGDDFITGDTYIGGAFHPRISGASFTLVFGGNAYFADTINPNVPSKVGCSGGLGGTVKIDGNSTMMGPYRAYTGVLNGSNYGGSINFNLEKNLVMGNNSYIDLGSGNISSSKFEVQKNVSVAKFNPSPPNLNYYPTKTSGGDDEFRLWPVLGKENSTLCLPAVTSATDPKMAALYPGYSLYKHSSGFYLKTKSGNVQSNCTPTAQQISDWGADPMDGTKSSKNYKLKLSDEPGVKSCEIPPIQFEMSIYNRIETSAAWVHRANKRGGCRATERCAYEPLYCNGSTSSYMELAHPSYSAPDIGKELEYCYEHTSTNERYPIAGSDWLVIYVKDVPNSINWGALNNQTRITKGKYIIIFDISVCPLPAGAPCFFYLPPTAPGVEVMLYLPNGYPGTIELAGTPGSGEGYNYFIFSDGDILQFNTTSSRKLNGNIFMNNCSVLNKAANSFNPYLIVQTNADLVKELMGDGILCMAEDGCGGQTPPPSSNTNTAYMLDEFFIPIGPRLKVELESKYISREKASEFKNIAKSVLVMPRVLRFKTDHLKDLTFKLDNYYNFLYLNNEQPPQILPEPKCILNGGTVELPIKAYVPDPTSGVYTCSFTDTKISPFYVQVNSKGGSMYSIGDPIVGGSSPSGISSSSVSSSSSSSSLAGGICGSPYRPTCNIGGDPIVCIVGQTIPIPTISCGAGVTAKDAKFEVSLSGGTGVGSAPGWNSNTNHSFSGAGEGRIVRMYQVTCGTTVVNCNTSGESGVDCGAINVRKTGTDIGTGICTPSSSSGGPSVTASCNLVNGNNAVDNVFTQGENIRATITCSNGENPSYANFTATGIGLPLLSSNWPDRNAYYISDPGPNGQTVSISVSSVVCGDVAVDPGPSCGTITVERPTCNRGGDLLAGQPIPIPDYSCGTAAVGSSPYHPRFNVSLANDSAIGGTPNWNTPSANHTFGSCANGRVVRMYQITCDEHTINYGTASQKSGIICGTINTIGCSSASGASSSSVPSSSSAGCAYQASWCDNQYPDAQSVPRVIPNASNSCFFVTGLTEFCSNDSPSKINGNNVSQGYIGCWGGGGTLPAKQDGGYYVYVAGGVGAINGTAGSAPNCGGGGGTSSSSSVTITCTVNDAGPHTGCKNIAIPTVSCGAGISASSPSFDYNGGAVWSSSSTQQFCNPTSGTPVYLNKVTCGTTTYTDRVRCANDIKIVAPSSSSVASSSSTIPTLTCTLAKTNVTLGENINTPTLSCSDGTTPGGTKSFSASSTQLNAVANWNNNTPTYFKGIPGGGGTATVSVSGVTCSGVSMGTTNCVNGSTTSITVINPTFNGLPTTVASGTTISAPNIQCGNAGSATNIQSGSFSTTSTNCSWNGSGTSGYFTRPTTGNCALTLNNLTCNGNSLSSLSIPCYTGSSGTNQNVSVTVASGDLCVAGSTVHLNAATNLQNLGTGAICIKRSTAINGWNVSNSAGRNCSINGGASFTPTDNTTLSGVPLTSDGYAYINCTAGTHSYFTMSYW